MRNRGISFLGTRLTIEGVLPVEIVPGHRFRAATSDEIDQIEKVLHNYLSVGSTKLPSPYRQTVNLDRETVILRREDWLYWVLEFDGTNQKIDSIAMASSLINQDIDIAFTLLSLQNDADGELTACVSPRLNQIEKWTSIGEFSKPPIQMSTSELLKIGSYYTLIEKAKVDHPSVYSALRNYCEARGLPGRTELKAVGYFAVIESLITHPPRVAESLDSITNQIVNKMVMLSKRFEVKVDFGTYFQPANPEKIWKKLYAFRSAIAHGSEPNFSTELKILRDREAIYRCLKDVTKQLLILALRDAEFLSDLKKC